MPEIVLSVHELHKNYGKVHAVKGISFEAGKGEIFSLIGPNGAGKTTTIRVIATLLKADSGEISVGGVSAIQNAMDVRRIISYLPDEAGAYKTLSGRAYLDFMASFYESDSQNRKKMVDVACERTGLGDRLKDKIGTYSRGMQRKLLISRAVMTNPVLAIMDEATSGLDINNALEIRNMLKELAREGMTFLLSSHNMLEIEYLSDRIAIIDKGVIHETGTCDEIKQKYGAANLEEVFRKVAKV